MMSQYEAAKQIGFYDDVMEGDKNLKQFKGRKYIFYKAFRKGVEKSRDLWATSENI